MANNPEAEWRESMYPHTTNTPGIVHETTTAWVYPWMTPPGVGMPRTKPRPSQAMAGAVNLTERAAELAAELDLPEPESIRWAQMRHMWGSCRGTHIDIAHAASTLPSWVLDHIIVHELAHLAVPGHGDDFDELVARYPRSREAFGYLLAVQDREWKVHRTPTNPRRRSPL